MSLYAEPFTSTPPANNYPPFQLENDVTDKTLEKNDKLIKTIQSDFSQTHSILLNNMKDLSNNITGYVSKTDYLQMNNSKYHYNDQQDPNVIMRPEESKDIKTAIQHDINEMKLYQNSIYVSSIIAGATILIAAIIIIPSAK
jgi:hypothetical protein